VNALLTINWLLPDVKRNETGKVTALPVVGKVQNPHVVGWSAVHEAYEPESFISTKLVVASLTEYASHQTLDPALLVIMILACA
jgi:hypothetical protein